MAYHSQFTGEQMDSVFRRILNTVTGTFELTAYMDGSVYIQTHVECSISNPKLFVNVDTADDIRCVAGYSPSGMLTIMLRSDRISAGNTFTVHYMLTE